MEPVHPKQKPEKGRQKCNLMESAKPDNEEIRKPGNYTKPEDKDARKITKTPECISRKQKKCINQKIGEAARKTEN